MKTESLQAILTDDFDYYIVFNLKLLSVIGLQGKYSERRSYLSKCLEKMPTFLMNLWGIVCGISEIWLIADALPGNASLAIKICGQLLTNVQCISKGFQLANAIQRTRVVLHDLGQCWNSYRPSGECRNIILNMASQTLYISKVYSAIVIGITISLHIPPIANFLYQYITRESRQHIYDYPQKVFFLKYPFEINSVSMYFATFAPEFLLLFASSLFWVNSDTLFIQMMTHVCIQFEILKHDIGYLIDKENIDERLRHKFVVFAKRHCELLRICDQVDDIYSPVIFVSLLAAAISLCVNVFGVRDTIQKGEYEETGTYFLVSVGVLLQSFLYCTFAERLTEQSLSIADAVYNSNWTQKHHKFGFYIQLIIMRAQKPYYCTALGFFNVSHIQLSSVISTSFSYYMMLNTVSTR